MSISSAFNDQFTVMRAIEALTDTVLKLQEQLDALEPGGSDDWKPAYTELNTRLQTAEAEIVQLQNDYAGLDIDEINSKITQIQSDITTITGEITSITSDIQNLKTSQINMNGTLNLHTTEISALKQQTTELTNDKQENLFILEGSLVKNIEEEVLSLGNGDAHDRFLASWALIENAIENAAPGGDYQAPITVAIGGPPVDNEPIATKVASTFEPDVGNDDDTLATLGLIKELISQGGSGGDYQEKIEIVGEGGPIGEYIAPQATDTSNPSGMFSKETGLVTFSAVKQMIAEAGGESGDDYQAPITVAIGGPPVDNEPIATKVASTFEPDVGNDDDTLATLGLIKELISQGGSGGDYQEKMYTDLGGQVSSEVLSGMPLSPPNDVLITAAGTREYVTQAISNLPTGGDLVDLGGTYVPGPWVSITEVDASQGKYNLYLSATTEELNSNNAMYIDLIVHPAVVTGYGLAGYMQLNAWAAIQTVYNSNPVVRAGACIGTIVKSDGTMAYILVKVSGASVITFTGGGTIELELQFFRNENGVIAPQNLSTSSSNKGRRHNTNDWPNAI